MSLQLARELRTRLHDNKELWSQFKAVCALKDITVEKGAYECIANWVNPDPTTILAIPTNQLWTVFKMVALKTGATQKYAVNHIVKMYIDRHTFTAGGGV